MTLDTLSGVTPELSRSQSGDRGPLDATGSRILDAALVCFGRRGIRNTPMEAIAAESGLARSSVYRYFRRKSDLINAVLMRELERFLAQFESTTADLAEPADIAVEGFVVTVRFIRSSSVLSELLVADSEELLPYLTVRGGSILAVARTHLLHRITGLDASADADVDAQEQLAETAVRLAMSFIFNRESVVDLEDDTALRTYARRCVAPLGEAMIAATRRPTTAEALPQQDGP